MSGFLSTPTARAPRVLALIALLAFAAPRVHAGTSAAAYGVSKDEAEAALGSHALRMLDGSSTTLASLNGQVVVVNFWATWCGPCRRELPRLDALNTTLRPRGGRVIAVSIDENPENVRAFARSARLKLAVAHDGPAGLARDLNLRHVPATVVLDRQGRIVWSTSRSDDAEMAKLTSLVRRLSDGRTAMNELAPGGAR